MREPPELLAIYVSDENNVIIEFTVEVSYQDPIVSGDFTLMVENSLGKTMELDYIIPEDAYYYLPSRILTLWVDDDRLIEFTQDQHSRISISIDNIDKIYNGYGVQMLEGTMASNYTAAGDPNKVDQFSTWWTFFFGRFYNVCAIVACCLVLLAGLLTTSTTLIPVYLIMYFTQAVYFTFCADIYYAFFHDEFLKHF